MAFELDLDTVQMNQHAKYLKEKERKSIYIAPFIYYMYISKRSSMDHTVLPTNTPCMPFLRKRSPDGAILNSGSTLLLVFCV